KSASGNEFIVQTRLLVLVVIHSSNPLALKLRAPKQKVRLGYPKSSLPQKLSKMRPDCLPAEIGWGKIGQGAYRRQGTIAIFFLYLNTPYFSNTSFTTPFFRLWRMTRALGSTPIIIYISG